MSKGIPKVKTWIVKIVDSTNIVRNRAEVDTINKRFAIWCAQDLGVYPHVGERYVISLKRERERHDCFRCTCLACQVKRLDQQATLSELANETTVFDKIDN